MKPYNPAKQSYNCLSTLLTEMNSRNVKVVSYDGASIKTKTHSYGLYDFQVTTSVIKQSEQ